MYVSFKNIKRIVEETYNNGESTVANPTSHKTHRIMSEVNNAYEAHIGDLSVFVVLCYRYGEEEGHTYFRGIFRTLEAAIADSINHYQERGGKYYPKVYKDSFNGNPELVFDYGEYEKEMIRCNK